jgi:glycosyltransferase involved in cell wall biosynthesis
VEVKKTPFDSLEPRIFEPLPEVRLDINPLVTVIVRTCNRPGLLRNCLKSLEKQTYRRFEVVVVNDGGEDIEDLIGSFSGRLKINYLNHPGRRGRPAALNTGLKNSAGRYISFLDDDDVYYTRHLEVLVRHLVNSDYKIAYTSTISRVYKESEKNGEIEFIKDGRHFDSDFDKKRILFENLIPIMCVMLERSVFETVGDFDEKMEIYEDWDYWIRASRLYDFLHINQTTAEYRYYDEKTMLPLHALKFDFEDWRKKLSEKHGEYISALPTEDKDRLIQSLEESIADMTRRIKSLERSVSEKDGAISAFNETISQKEIHLSRLENQLKQKDSQLNHIYNSHGWKALVKYYKIRDRALPPESTRRKVLKVLWNLINHFNRQNIDKSLFYIRHNGFASFLKKVRGKLPVYDEQGPGLYGPGGDETYQRWIERNEPSPAEYSRQRQASFPYTPVISLIVSSFSTRPQLLKQLIKSVLDQTYPRWELCTACREGSCEQGLLQDYARKDGRIKVKVLAEDKGAAANSNSALKLAEGEFVACVGPHDRLPPCALFEVVKAVNGNPDADFVYSDSDSISLEGKRFAPHFKPDWSPDTLVSWNYISNIALIKSSLVEKGGFLREGFEGAETYDLILRATEAALKVVHVPKVLYHARRLSGGGGFQPADGFGLLTGGELKKKVLRQSNPASLRDKKDDRSVRPVEFSLMILTRDAPEFIIPLIDSLVGAGLGSFYEVIVGDTGSTDAEVLGYYRGVPPGIKIVKGLKYHFGRNYNYLAREFAHGRVLGFMNNDVILPSTGFLKKIHNTLEDPAVGVVGTKLLYADGRLQHGGVFFMENGKFRGLPYHRMHGGDPALLPALETEQVPATTGAFMYLRREDFIKMGGFDESYEEESQDIDLCLKFLRSGKRVVFLNIDNIVHVENGTRPRGSENWRDRKYFAWKWGSFVEAAVLGTELNREKKQDNRS